jgi:hypothetical protein
MQEQDLRESEREARDAERTESKGVASEGSLKESINGGFSAKIEAHVAKRCSSGRNAMNRDRFRLKWASTLFERGSIVTAGNCEVR